VPGATLITAAESARDDDFACPIAAPAKVKVNSARSAEHVETDKPLAAARGGEGHNPVRFPGLYVGMSRYRI
jgi:hypothetical protein